MQYALQQSNISNLTVSTFQNVDIYNFDSNMSVDNQNYKISITIHAINDFIGRVSVKLEDDIFDEYIKPMFAQKYGWCIYIT